MSFRRYTDLQSWLRHLWKGSLHAGTGSILSVVGTNGAESLAPAKLAGVGLDLRQMFGVFAAAVLIEALRRIHQATADTKTPFQPTPPQP